jgi:hypothetical protein
MSQKFIEEFGVWGGPPWPPFLVRWQSRTRGSGVRDGPHCELCGELLIQDTGARARGIIRRVVPAHDTTTLEIPDTIVLRIANRRGAIACENH